VDVEKLAEEVLEGIRIVVESSCDPGNLKELENNAIKLFAYYGENNFEIDYEVEVALLGYDPLYEISELINDCPLDGIGDNPTDCVELLEIIFKYIYPLESGFGIILACNPHTPIEILRKLIDSDFEDGEKCTTQSLAEYTSDSELLDLLSSKSHGATKWMVARNSATSTKTLDKLASDSDYAGYMLSNGEKDSGIFVQCNVIDNPNTSIEALEKIADGTYSIVGGPESPWSVEFLEALNLELQELAKSELQSRNS
jgi:hypothetical protein